MSFAACGETNDTQLATTRQEAFSGRTAKEKWREHMKENPYKRLPPIERRQDGSLYRMTPAQRKQANALIRRECCCCEDGNCIVLDDGDTCTCPQTVSFSVCCKWFRWAVLPLDGRQSVRPKIQPGKILPRLCRQSSQAAENRK